MCEAIAGLQQRYSARGQARSSCHNWRKYTQTAEHPHIQTYRATHVPVVFTCEDILMGLGFIEGLRTCLIGCVLSKAQLGHSST